MVHPGKDVVKVHGIPPRDDSSSVKAGLQARALGQPLQAGALQDPGSRGSYLATACNRTRRVGSARCLV